ncbi:DNA cytosine methyltransferase [Faecalibacillus intestinalis]|jgi:DNA (cytosine-5)-methyltransferase 1|uniref:DNA cytosine methyltransferase n=1 Tax=Faecalibacillus intestinalis TaxID=1982626 RepID=UPI000E4CB3D4|nr:DNA cytosine methyltransferase [Faecalibacillus intestinalis]RHR92377.1 DNA cytosine methyltransferase [Coprobacillus sp. AF15-30]
MKPRVIDLFAGVGGLSLGFEKKGFDVVLANEYDASIATSYIANHKNTKMIVGDITSLDLEDTFGKLAGTIDVVIGGPPCQGFSQKGQRKTIHDERNFLFKYYVSVVELVKPKYFVMENVPNLLTAEGGYFRHEIEELFNKLGYSLEYGVLNASDYGIPQNRRRAVIIGKLDGDAPKLPVPKRNNVTIWDAISDLAYLESGEGSEEQEYKYPAESDYEKMLRKDSSKLFNHIATKHSPLALERLALIPPNAGREVLPEEHLTKSIYSGTWTRMKKDEISVTITTRFDTPSSGKFTHPFLNRAITVREAARIQSFPDNFHFVGNKGSQMKQVGNAVPPLLAAAIAEVIMNDIKEETKHE